MPTRRHFLYSSLAAAAATTLAACSKHALVPAPSATGEADARLNALLDRMFQAQLQASPESLSSFGLDHGDRAAAKSRLDDRSIAARERFAHDQHEFLTALDAIDRRRLSAGAAVNLDAARYLCALFVQGTRQFGYALPNASRPYVVSQINGAYLDVPGLLDSLHSIETHADAEAYLSRLAALPAAIDQDSERARADAARGVVPPDFIIDKALSQLKALRDAAPTESPLVASLLRRTGEKQLAGDWQARATQTLQGPLPPALERQIALLESWRAQAVSTPGLARLPDGEAYYRWALQLNTTTQSNAADIHRQAQEQVAEYSARIDGLLRSQGYTDGGVGRRYLALAKDPRYLYPDSDAGKAQRIDDMEARLHDIQARLPRYFGNTPQAQPTLRRLPPALAYFHPGATPGARPNVVFLSERNIPQMPKWELANWFYHEAIPGHHLQASLALESPQVPRLSQVASLPAFTEGWSLYCEQLADEMGVYADDPLAPLGYLRSFLLRAMHTVVDTGVHALGWSRQRAVAYVSEISGDEAPVASNRVDRYCAMPGQALVFKFGHSRWLALRARAQQALGAQFDLRGFHDAALRHGALPLDVLERVIDDWIQSMR